MTIRAALTLPALLLLSLAPGLALASPNCDRSVSMTCAEGTVWDAATRSCIATTS
ncbi:adenylosuccinate lyase [Frigidibacter sp. MR17.24]|uniref:adenylosuccinate lyase n=1 Tax=Frigidibacter sp. MR17.24 TaxID=3127345 RepID=UPI0030130690